MSNALKTSDAQRRELHALLKPARDRAGYGGDKITAAERRGSWLHFIYDNDPNACCDLPPTALEYAEACQILGLAPPSRGEG